MAAVLRVTPHDFFSLTRFHPVPLVAILLAVAWYAHRVRRFDATGERWPRARIGAFAVAVLVVAVSTLSGLDAFLRVSFAVHALQQLGLFMVAPPFLALAAPVTLAMKTGRPSTAERIRSVIDSRAARVIGHPVFTWALNGTVLFALYFSGQYRAGIDHAWVLQLTNLELLAVGFLFASVVVGADPKPHRLAIGWRILYLMVATIFYSLLGLAMESQSTRIAPMLTVADLHTGGGDVWSTAELFSIAATIAVVFQWLMVDEGHARRNDRSNAEEDARQLAAWRANRRAAALADVRAKESVIARSRPSGTERSDAAFGAARQAPGPPDPVEEANRIIGRGGEPDEP